MALIHVGAAIIVRLRRRNTPSTFRHFDGRRGRIVPWSNCSKWQLESAAMNQGAILFNAVRLENPRSTQLCGGTNRLCRCWEIHTTYFAEAEGLLDWYHASEHVHAVAKIVAPNDADAWAKVALDQLWNDGGESLIPWLESQIKGRRGKPRAALNELRNYLLGQRDHLAYSRYRERGWPIGTGRMESSCKQLVGVRLKGPGMHWSEKGALAMTALKATQLNGKWHQFWKTLTLAT